MIPLRPYLIATVLACGSSRALDPPSAAAAEAPSGAAAASPERVVAIGDLHGDLAQARAALALAGVLGEDGGWSGGATVLVQTGDVFDRGPDSRAILDLLRRLQREAPLAGGAVHTLLGNHEVMNLTGDLRYVHPGEIDAFGGPAARAAAFAPTAEYGAWLRAQPAVVVVADTAFAHGGVTEAWARLGVERINARVRDSLALPPAEAARADVLGPDGPLWYRGYLTDPEEIACPRLERALRDLGATRMVVGHTTQRSGRIAERCGGRLHGIDIGIASVYGGNLGVWSLSASGALAIHPEGSIPLSLAAPTEPAQP